MMKSYLLFCGIIIFCLTSCTATATEHGLFWVMPDHASNRITAAVEDHTAVLDIYSERGIGRAGVQWLGGDYPDRILLRFHLRGLEELHFAYATTEITVAIPSSGGFATRQQRTATEADSRQPQLITPDNPYWMKTAIVANGTRQQNPIPLTEGWIEVEVPPHFLQGRYTGFAIHWIDFYR